MSGPRIGVALDDRELVARSLDGAQWSERVSLDAAHRGMPRGMPTTDALTDALSRLRARLEDAGQASPGGRPGLSVALLAPLVQFRRIELPPLPDDEVEALLRRDAARYFPGGSHRRVVATLPREAGRGAVRVVAAPAHLLEAVVEAAAATGFRIDGITAGWHALAATAIDGDGRVAIARRGELQVLTVENGAPAELRRAPVDETGAWRRLLGGGALVLVGDGPDLETVRSALTAAGVEVGTPAAGGSAAGLAARGASSAHLRLVPDGLRVARDHRNRRRGVRLLAAAAVLGVLAVVVHHAGLRRDLARVQADRAAIAAEVSPLLTMRDSLRALNEDVRAVREVSSRSYDWATALSELALLLPRETYLTSLSGSEGVLEFEAAGERAGAAIDALRSARSLSGVRLEGLVERELEDGATVVERFRLGARVRVREPEGVGAAGTSTSGTGGTP